MTHWDHAHFASCCLCDNKISVFNWAGVGHSLMLLIAFIERSSSLSSRLTALLSQMILNECLAVYSTF